MWHRFKWVVPTLGLLVLGGTMVGQLWGADDVVSAPAGFHRIDLLGNSDTLVSFPFTRPEAAVGRVATPPDGNVVTLAGSPGWTPNQFVYAAGVQPNSYFMQIRSGTKEGFYYPVLGNGADSLTLNLAGDTLAGLIAGDRVAIIPYWTLGTVFPGGQGVHVTASPGDRLTEVLLPDLNGVGINRSASKAFYFWNGTWRQVGQGLATMNDEVLLPDAYVVVRHNVGQTTTLTIRGAVATIKWAVPLTVGTIIQDNMVGWMRPVAVNLRDSRLLESGAFSASPTPGNRTDELLAFDNSVVGKNKSAAVAYYYWNGAWRVVGGGIADKGDAVVFAPGTGAIIRKNAGLGTPVWVSTANY